MGRNNRKKKEARIAALREKEMLAEEIIEIKEEEKPTILDPLYKVQVVQAGLRRRAAPSYDAEVRGIIRAQDTLKVYVEAGEWGRLGDGTWIALKYTKKI